MNNKLIGYNECFLNLINLFNKNSLPNKILISGKRGIGKSLLAEHLINFIYSADENHKYDLKNFEINKENKSNILFQNDSHPNIFKIYKNYEKKHIEIFFETRTLTFSSIDDIKRSCVSTITKIQSSAWRRKFWIVLSYKLDSYRAKLIVESLYNLLSENEI